MLSVVDESKINFMPSFCAACLMTSAYALAEKTANLSLVTFKTLSTPYFDNSETSPVFMVRAVTVVPNDSATFLHKKPIRKLLFGIFRLRILHRLILT